MVLQLFYYEIIIVIIVF